MADAGGAGASRYVFFVDECLGGAAVPGALRAAGYSVRTAKELGLVGAKDDAVIAAVTQQSLVILSKDKRMRNRNQWQADLMRHDAAAFFLLRGDLGAQAMSDAIIAAMPVLLKKLDKMTRPLIGTISSSGEVTIIHGERRGGVKKEPAT